MQLTDAVDDFKQYSFKELCCKSLLKFMCSIKIKDVTILVTLLGLRNKVTLNGKGESVCLLSFY